LQRGVQSSSAIYVYVCKRYQRDILSLWITVIDKRRSLNEFSNKVTRHMYIRICMYASICDMHNVIMRIIYNCTISLRLQRNAVELFIIYIIIAHFYFAYLNKLCKCHDASRCASVERKINGKLTFLPSFAATYSLHSCSLLFL